MSLPQNPTRTYLSTKEFAVRNGLSDRHVRESISEGSLPAVRLGRRVLVPSDALDLLHTAAQ
jgi:excisionase family DNA binding protein